MKDSLLILRLALYAPSLSDVVMLNVSSAAIPTQLLLHVMSAVGLALSVSHTMLTRLPGDTDATGNGCIMVTLLAGIAIFKETIILLNDYVLYNNP